MQIDPEEIADTCGYLASPLDSATTGAAVRVAGGHVDAILPWATRGSRDRSPRP